MKTKKHLLAMGTTLAVSCLAFAQETTNEPPVMTDTNAVMTDTNAIMDTNAPPKKVEQYRQVSGANAQTPQTLTPIKASKLLHTVVQNNRGEVLGIVRDLVVDWQKGTTPFAVVTTGGVLGMGVTSRVVPTPALSPFPGKFDVFVLNISDDRWASAPTFHRARVAKLLGEEGKNVYQYYGQDTKAIETAAQTGTPTPTGRETGEATDARSFHMASNLIDLPVYNREDQLLGKINDLLVNWKGNQPCLAVMRSGGVLKGGEEFVLSMRSLSLGERSDRYIIDATPTMFAEAPKFETSKWGTEIKPESGLTIYHFPEIRD